MKTSRIRKATRRTIVIRGCAITLPAEDEPDDSRLKEIDAAISEKKAEIEAIEKDDFFN